MQDSYSVVTIPLNGLTLDLQKKSQAKLTAENIYNSLIFLMENTRFELVTSALQGRRSPI